MRPQDETLAEEVHPALSAEEWLQYGHNRAILRDFAADRRPWGPRRRYSYEEKLHAAAALALYGQQFGFTFSDVELLRSEADLHDRHGTREDVGRATRLRDLAMRIAAVLPPPGIKPQPPGSVG